MALTTAISKQRSGIVLLSLGTCFLYLNPLNLNNEVFPYFLLALFFLKIDLSVTIICSAIMLSAGVWVLIDPAVRAIIDAANIAAMLIGASMFNRLAPSGRLSVVFFFHAFLLLNFAVCLLQLFSEQFQLFTSSFFTSDYRPNVLESVRARNGGVTGLGPEPAYTAVLVVGLGMIVSAYKPEKLSMILLVFATLLLLRSVSGFLYGLVYLIFILVINHRATFLSFLNTRNVLFVAISIIIFLTIGYIEWARLDQIGSRLIQFFVLLLESRDLLQAESQFGSDRLIGIYLSFSQPILAQYGTGFSPAAALNFLFGTSLASLIVAGLLLIKRSWSISYLISLLFVFIAGPKLLWPIFFFGLFGTGSIYKLREHMSMDSVTLDRE